MGFAIPRGVGGSIEGGGDADGLQFAIEINVAGDLVVEPDGDLGVAGLQIAFDIDAISRRDRANSIDGGGGSADEAIVFRIIFAKGSSDPIDSEMLLLIIEVAQRIPANLAIHPALPILGASGSGIFIDLDGRSAAASIDFPVVAPDQAFIGEGVFASRGQHLPSGEAIVGFTTAFSIAIAIAWLGGFFIKMKAQSMDIGDFCRDFGRRRGFG